MAFKISTQLYAKFQVQMSNLVPLFGKIPHTDIMHICYSAALSVKTSKDLIKILQ